MVLDVVVDPVVVDQVVVSSSVELSHISLNFSRESHPDSLVSIVGSVSISGRAKIQLIK